MKLLFDQNISFRVVDKLLDIFPDSAQVRNLNLENATDLEILNFARENNYTIVTFDSDFCDLSAVKGYPPKIIWIRTGNTRTREIINLLRNKKDLIEIFLEEEYGCLELT